MSGAARQYRAWRLPTGVVIGDDRGGVTSLGEAILLEARMAAGMRYRAPSRAELTEHQRLRGAIADGRRLQAEHATLSNPVRPAVPLGGGDAGAPAQPTLAPGPGAPAPHPQQRISSPGELRPTAGAGHTSPALDFSPFDGG